MDNLDFSQLEKYYQRGIISLEELKSQEKKLKENLFEKGVISYEELKDDTIVIS